MQKEFIGNLLKWNQLENKRTMPWKGVKDPYKIWLSEIILQQTRVEQGLTYYEKFLQHFPTVKHLASADDQFVFKQWEGLGYYSRCKNLLTSARYISDQLKGQFPKTYNEILLLKGVGPYTASAIASFAYNEPFAVVDGNVLRVLSRYFGSMLPIDTTSGRAFYNQLAQKLISKAQPAQYNQAIMDFGATICKPQLPLCDQCVMNTRCVALKKNWVNKLPVKANVIKKRSRWLYYFVFKCEGDYSVQLRTDKDIWQNLFQFHLLELSEKKLWNQNAIENYLTKDLKIEGFEINAISDEFTQKLTHQNITGQFIQVNLADRPQLVQNTQWVPQSQLALLGFPKCIRQYVDTAL